jgi:hypothetical protein
MYTQMNALAASDALSSLNGWEIGGIVALLIVAGIGLWMLPEFLRYMKIRHM